MGLYTRHSYEVRRKTSMIAWVICGLGALFYCYEYFLRISPSVMSTELMRDYHLTATQFGNLTAFYYYAYTPMQIIVGICMDRYGPRLLVTFACLCCAVGIYLFACSDLFIVASIGRFLVGFGSAFAFVGALKLATIWLPPERFALVAGMITALGNVGAMLGDMALTSLVKNHGWRETSMLSAILGIGLAVLIVLVVRDSTKQVSPKKDLLIGFNRVFGGLYEALKKRQIWLNGLIGGLLYIPTTAFAELWGIPYLEQARGFSAEHAAATVSMIFLGWAVGCPVVGFISDYMKRRLLPVIVGGFFALIVSCYILYTPDLSFGLASVLFLILGICCCVQMLVFAIGRESSPAHIAGTAIAFTNMFVMISGVIFQPVIGMLLDKGWAGQTMHGARVYSAMNFQHALTVIPIGLALSLVITFFMKETRCKLMR